MDDRYGVLLSGALLVCLSRARYVPTRNGHYGLQCLGLRYRTDLMLGRMDCLDDYWHL